MIPFLRGYEEKEEKYVKKKNDKNIIIFYPNYN